MKHKKFSHTYMAKRLCMLRKQTYSDAKRRQYGRIVNIKNTLNKDNSQYIRLSDVIDIAEVLNVCPCLLAIGSLKDIEQHMKTSNNVKLFLNEYKESNK